MSSRSMDTGEDTTQYELEDDSEWKLEGLRWIWDNYIYVWEIWIHCMGKWIFEKYKFDFDFQC